jgi:hypothetical protein
MASAGGQDTSEQASEDAGNEFITLRRRRRTAKVAVDSGDVQQAATASQPPPAIKGPNPLPLHTLQKLIRDGDELPIELPVLAELKARLERVRTVVSRIKEVFPNPGCHSRGPAGPRLPQGIGLSIEKGTAGGGEGASASVDDGPASNAGLPAPAVSVSEGSPYFVQFRRA